MAKSEPDPLLRPEAPAADSHRSTGMRSRTRSPESNGVAALPPPAIVVSNDESLPAERCREIHRLMVRSRAVEERMIKMSKSGEGYFWIGGPGEEAFNVCLGLQVKKGEGPAYD